MSVWNHRPEAARRLVDSLSAQGYRAHAVEHLQDAAREADIISCATLSPTPLIAGAWLNAGQHLDLVGAFNMHMREVDDAALTRARIFVDTNAALSEGGDVALALKSGALTRADVVADLAALTRGASGRGGPDEITLFKSVGAAIEDLAAAMLVWKKAGGGKF
jgi:ornithine cyclodeaminase